MQNRIFYWTIWKPTVQAFQKTLTFDRYLFNSRSNFHVNLVHWNSLHQKWPFYLLFLGQTPHFLCENHKTRSDNQHHRKAGSVAVILSLRVGVQHIQKVCNNVYNAVAAECTLYLSRPPTYSCLPSKLCRLHQLLCLGKVRHLCQMPSIWQRQYTGKYVFHKLSPNIIVLVLSSCFENCANHSNPLHTRLL